MKNLQLKDDFLGIMTFTSICCYIIFTIVRRFTENKFLMIISFMLVITTIIILLEFGVRKYALKNINIEFKPIKYFSLLLINTFLAIIIFFYFLK
jgi:Na+-translocating ferredoxin:NAD+ oxidoreductase RnfA subunit